MHKFDYSLCDVMNAGVVKLIIIGLIRIFVVKLPQPPCMVLSESEVNKGVCGLFDASVETINEL